MLELNSTYEDLRFDLQSIDSLLERATLIHEGRNTLWRVEVEGQSLCVKRYGFSSMLKRWIYRYLRPSKAQKAWHNTICLRQAGIDSPEPVALIETYSLRGIENSYYICRYEQGSTLYRWGDCALQDIQQQVVQLAHFAASLHRAGLMLTDFTPGNILLADDHFILVDTNRMNVGKVSIKRGLKNMAGLWLQPEVAELLAREYVTARGGSDIDKYARAFAQYRRLFWLRFTQRHYLRDVISHYDLDGTCYMYHFNTTIR